MAFKDILGWLLGVTLIVGALCAGGMPRASAQELLQNPDFEEGLTDWVSSHVSSAGCAAHSGNTGILLEPADGSEAVLQQTVPGPMALAPYVLSGWVKLASGSAGVSVDMLWLDAGDGHIGAITSDLDVTASYTRFSVEPAPPPDGAVSLRVRVSASSDDGGSVCLDDLTLDGPPPATVTPTSSLPPASATPLRGSATPLPATRTATSTPTPTATRTPGPSFVFTNGGFEEGAHAWRKFGGELDVVSSPRLSGEAAGVLVSTTASTKWAYQSVAIDAANTCEFSGNLLASGDFAQAGLRISWYATDDASGDAISASDSSDQVGVAGSTFVHLSTGAVQPPPGAKSAKLRAVLTPGGAAPAGLYMDDMAFAAVAAPTATATQTSSAPEAGSGQPTAAVAAGATHASTADSPLPKPSASASPRPTSRRVSEVSETRADMPAAAAGPLMDESAAGSGGVPLPWIGAAALFVVALGGAYAQGKRRPP